MTLGKWIGTLALTLSLATTAGTLLLAQAPAGRGPQAQQPGRDKLTQPVYRVAQAQDAVAANGPNAAQQPNGAQPPNAGAAHPLDPALEIAYTALGNIRNNIRDYSCTMVKRERIGDKLGEREYMFLKVRHEPFGVYMYFLGPDKLRGQEAMYVAGKNNGNLLGHGVGIKKIAGTVPLLPTGAMAMQGQRYPITEIGILNLTKRLIEVAEEDRRFGECEVKFFKDTKLTSGKETRLVTCIQVIHPTPRRNFRFHLARVYVDNELQIPVRYESFDWPTQPGGQPILLEEYTYTDLKINNGFTDADFDEHNPNYSFH